MPRKLPHLLLPTTDSTKEPSPHLKKQFVLLSQIDDTVYFLSLCVFATMMNVQQPPAQEAPRRSVLGDVNPNTVRPATSHSDKHSATSTNKTTSVVLAASTTITPNSDPPAELPVPPEDPNSILEQEALAMDWKEAQKSVDYLFDDCLKTQFKGVPKIAMPKILQKNGLQLFPHQVDAIRWLTHREKTNSDAPPFFAERKFGSKVYWSDKIQSGRVNYDEKPEPVKGSVLADEMGLGKTLQTIGLILSSRPTGVRSYPIKNDLPLDTPRCTLIVAPVSVMATWAQEFEKYVNKNSEVLKIDFYQGYKRHRALDKVKSGSLDVLIVSYETLAADLKKSRKASRSTQSQRNEDDTEDTEEDEDGSIFDLMFHRFVLDEAHLVRNATTKAFRACKGIQSTHTLALTGTPFINNPMDIQSLFAILKVHPLSEKDVFNDYIQQPILDRKEIGLSKLRLALASVCLRRTKDGVEHSLDLAEKTVELRKIGFTGPHKQVHDKLYEVCRKAYLGLMRAGGNHFRTKAFTLFGLMLRIRQSCCSASIIRECDLVAVESVWDKFHALDLELLDESNGLELFDTLVGALKASKGGGDIDDDSGNSGNGQDDDINDRPNKRIRVQATGLIPRDLGRSPKVVALMEEIHKLPADEKGVVYSQWTTFLDVVQQAMVEDGIPFTRIDGSMDAPSRLQAMKTFEGTTPTPQGTEPRVMLCSLKAAGTGINLTRANHVYMMDCWWNVAQENQAMDRIHRIGQERPVEAIRFVMADSIEERVLQVQEAKETLGKGILKRLKKTERGKAKVTALRDLFEMDQHQFIEWDGVYEDEDDDLRRIVMGDE